MERTSRETAIFHVAPTSLRFLKKRLLFQAMERISRETALFHFAATSLRFLKKRALVSSDGAHLAEGRALPLRRDQPSLS
jgi:hypothetical protein